MPEGQFSPNEIPVIIVTSLRPRERPRLSVRQRRIAEFCSVEADRKCRKSRRGGCKRTPHCIVSIAAPFRAGKPCLVMEQHEETQSQEDVTVLLPARDILYSDSEVAIRSARSTGRVSKDPPPSFICARSSECLEMPPRPCSRFGPIAGAGVGDRYLKKPPEGFVSRDEVFGIDKRPYGQVWHNHWEHPVVESSKPVHGPLEQFSRDINSSPSVERKQRRGVFSTGLTYRSKTVNRPWGRPVHQRTPSTGTRSVQRKLSAMKDEGDSEALRERVPRMRRSEPPRRKQGVPRVVVTTASRPMTAISTEKLEVPSSAPSKSASANTGATSENRTARLSTMKPLSRPRFSVPIKASRVPMDVYFKEMSVLKPRYSRKDVSAPIKFRGQHRGAEMPFHDLSQDTAFFRDAGCDLPERSHLAVLRSGRRMFNRPALEASDSNPYSTSLQVDGECMPFPKNILASDSPTRLSNPRATLGRNYTDRSEEHGPHWNLNSGNASVMNHLYGRSVPCRETPLRYKYSTETDGLVHPVSRFPIPAFYQDDLPVPSHYPHDDQVHPSQTTQTYHFSHNAPDVLISPPPNPRHRIDSLRVPGRPLGIEPTPVTACNSPCITDTNFIPRYLDLRSHEVTIENHLLMPQPFLQPNMTPRPFMPSVDFSRNGSPPRPHPDVFPYVRSTGFENFLPLHTERPPYLTNLQQAGVQVPIPAVEENALKPAKLLLTFGAQVPSSERVRVGSFTFDHLSSPRVETEGQFSDQQDHLQQSPNPNAPSVMPTKATKQDDIKMKMDTLAASSKVTQEIDPDSRNCVKDSEKPSLLVDMPCDEEGDFGAASEKDESVYTILTGNVSNDRPLPIKPSSYPIDCISNERSKWSESSARLLGLVRTTRSLRVCARSLSDTKLSTLTERSSDSKQLGETPSAEVGDVQDDLLIPRAAVAPRIPEAEQELRFQLVKGKRVEGPREEMEDPETEALRCTFFKLDPPVIQSRAKSLEALHGEISITEICDDESSAFNDVPSEQFPSEQFGPSSDLRLSNTESTTYRLSAIDRYTNGKTSFTGSGPTCLDDSRASSVVQSINSSVIRQRFHSAVSNIGARRHIALQCKLAEKSATGSTFAEEKSTPTLMSLNPSQPVGRRDVCVQVPISCVQSVETDRYTTERGVPECRAGLTLRLMSTVVDVPPVVKVTESVGIGTEDVINKEGSPTTESCESETPCEVISDETTRRTSSDNFADDRRPLVNAMTSPQSLRRLRPFFRSHCDEFANICALAAVPLRTEKNRSHHQNLRSDPSTTRDRHRSSCDEDNQHDRRRDFRLAKGEFSLQTNASFSRNKDEYHKNHRTSDAHKIKPLIADDQPTKPKSPSRRPADIPDQKHSRNVGRENRAACRRKVGEPPEVSRPSTGSADNESARRKAGCGVCKKDHIRTSQKKAVMKGQRAEMKTPDIRGSLMHLGLSNIITLAGNHEPSNVESKEPINENSWYDGEFQRRSSRPDDDCLKGTTFKTKSDNKGVRNNSICENRGSSPVVLVRDSLAFNNPRKDLRREVFGDTDPGASSVHKTRRGSVTSSSAVPTIYLTKAEKNDVPDAEDTSLFPPPIQIGFNRVDTKNDFSVSPKLEDADRVPLEESNFAVDVKNKQPLPPYVHTLKNSEDVKLTITENSSNPPEDAELKTFIGNVEHVEMETMEELDKDANNPVDDGVKQTSSSVLDDKLSAESGGFDSENSLEPSGGCVYTAMRRYMKFHKRPERTSEPAYWNKCPGFRFTGVPANEDNSGRKRGYRDCCKCALNGSDLSPGTPEVAPSRAQRRPRDSLTSHRNVLAEEAIDSSKKSESRKTNIRWQSVFQRSATRPAAVLEDNSTSIHRDSPRTLRDIVSSLKYAKGVCCSESYEKLEELAEEPTTLCTLPSDMAAAEDFRLRYPRCAVALPESSVGARRRSFAPGEVRIRHSRCWSSDHASARRYLHDLPTIPADTYHRRTARHRISWVDEEELVEDDRDDEKHNVFCYRYNYEDHEV